MSTTSDNGRTTWQAIATDLQSRITEGEYRDGERLPSHRQLVETYGAAERTVSRALHQLRDDGFIVGLPRAGWLVRGQRSIMRSVRSRLSRSERDAGRGTFATDCHAAGLEADVTVDVRIEPAPASVAAVLDVDSGEAVCVRDRVMRGGSEVLQLATSYLPRDLTRGTAMEAADSGPGGIYRRLEEAGHALTEFTERVAIGRASEHEAHQMRLNIAEPVFRVTRTAWSGDRAVEVNEITITGTRFELVYELPSQ